MADVRKLAWAADHRGYPLIERVLAHYASIQPVIIDWHACGAFSEERTDYPVYAQKAVDALKQGVVEGAILLCGTGIGMAMAANRTRGIYAGVAWNADIARRAREEDKVNCLVLPADYLSSEEAIDCIDSWLRAAFKGGRYGQRIAQIDKE